MTQFLMVALTIAMTACDRRADDVEQLGSRKIVHPNDPFYLDWQLSRYGLERLSKDGEVRFLWLRSFHTPMVFEIANDNTTYTARQWKNRRWSMVAAKSFKPDDSPFVSAGLLDIIGFFETPSFTETDLRHSDGAAWIFEAHWNGQRHWVWKQSPKEDTEFGRWGRELIGACIDSPAVPIY